MEARAPRRAATNLNLTGRLRTRWAWLCSGELLRDLIAWEQANITHHSLLVPCFTIWKGPKYVTQCNTTASYLTAMPRTASSRPPCSPPCIASRAPGTESDRWGFFATRQDCQQLRRCGE